LGQLFEVSLQIGLSKKFHKQPLSWTSFYHLPSDDKKSQNLVRKNNSLAKIGSRQYAPSP
jgi:hypothetical protein